MVLDLVIKYLLILYLYYNMRDNFSVGGDWKSTTKAGLLSRQVIGDITELTYVKCTVLDDKAE